MGRDFPQFLPVWAKDGASPFFAHFDRDSYFFAMRRPAVLFLACLACAVAAQGLRLPSWGQNKCPEVRVGSVTLGDDGRFAFSQEARGPWRRQPPPAPPVCRLASGRSLPSPATLPQHSHIDSHRAAAGGVAWGSYLDSARARSNFGQLRVNTSGAYSDADQLYAAGFLEGYLTAERVCCSRAGHRGLPRRSWRAGGPLSTDMLSHFRFRSLSRSGTAL